MYTGLTHPNYGEMGMESGIPQGSGGIQGYGNSGPTSGAGLVTTSSQVGNQDSAKADIGYSRYTPKAGFADRLAANVPFQFMCYPIGINWIGLKNKFDALEERREGLESNSGTFSEAEYNPWPLDACCNKPIGNRGCYVLPTISLDAVGK